MKWPVILPLFFAIPIIMGSAVLGDEEDDDMTEFERARRIPFMLPTTFLGRRQYGFENEGDNDDSADGMKRKRIPYYFPHSKFDLWRDLVADPNEGDEMNDEYEDFERKRRGVFLFPNMSNKWKKRSDSSTEDLKELDVKRGSPYFFPLYHYRPTSYKRVFNKRSLIDAFTMDDPTAFGYDKREEATKKSDIENQRKKKSS